jgi:hypothetical protein
MPALCGAMMARISSPSLLRVTATEALPLAITTDLIVDRPEAGDPIKQYGCLPGSLAHHPVSGALISRHAL